MSASPLLQDDGLFFVCSLIEQMGRMAHRPRPEVVRALGEERIAHVYELADAYHCVPLEQTALELIEETGLAQGDFDNVAACRYARPSSWDIGKVFKRLAAGIAAEQDLDAPAAVVAAFTSPVEPFIEDFNGAFYYEAPQNILLEHLIAVGAA